MVAGTVGYTVVPSQGPMTDDRITVVGCCDASSTVVDLAPLDYRVRVGQANHATRIPLGTALCDEAIR